MNHSNFAFAIHGGAGTILRSAMTPEKEAAYLKALNAALEAGRNVLKNGGKAGDAVSQAIVSLEDCPLFNAGRGSVFTNTGAHEMDASIMLGDSMQAGAVAGVSKVRNPILLAREVMKKTEHVMLCGSGAEAFAKQQGIKMESDDYFYDAFRFEQWQAVKGSDEVRMDHHDKKFGTVGAVALDVHGNLAAGTSTGGMTNKKYGRVGDTPIIGAGTYANNNTCAVSCTGHGEYFIRSVVAYDISCLMEYKGLSLKAACEKVVLDKLVKTGGEGGIIALDNKGNIELVFNSEGMYRGWAKDGEEEIRIYR